MARTRIGAMLLIFLACAACGRQGEEVAVIRTDRGNIVVAFYNDTPRHVENFKKLAREGFYDGTAFHRVIPGFMIQGGDPNSRDDDRSNDGLGGPGYTLAPEIKHQHIRGAVAAARLSDRQNPKRESSGSQFYICVQPQPHLDNGYTVFGYVVEGMDVVQKIATVQRDKGDNPIHKVLIEKVSIERRRLKYRPS